MQEQRGPGRPKSIISSKVISYYLPLTTIELISAIANIEDKSAGNIITNAISQYHEKYHSG